MQAAAPVTQAYFQTQVHSRSSLELVVMLYDGATKFLRRAREATSERDASIKRESISRALAIIAELQNTLDMDAGGDIAASLDALYLFVRQRLLDANLGGDPAAIDESLRVLAPLRDAWAEIANRPPGAQEVG